MHRSEHLPGGHDFSRFSGVHCKNYVARSIQSSKLGPGLDVQMLDQDRSQRIIHHFKKSPRTFEIGQFHYQNDKSRLARERSDVSISKFSLYTNVDRSTWSNTTTQLAHCLVLEILSLRIIQYCYESPEDTKGGRDVQDSSVGQVQSLCMNIAGRRALRRAPTVRTRLCLLTCQLVDPVTMSFSTARIIQELREKHRSDELERKLYEKQKAIGVAAKTKRDSQAKQRSAGRKVAVTGKKAKQTSEEQAVLSDVEDSEPERLRRSQAAPTPQVGCKAQETAGEGLGSSGPSLAGEAEIDLVTPEPGDSASDVEIVGDVRMDMNLDRYRYDASAPPRVPTSRAGLADREKSKKAKSALPQPGSIERFVKPTGKAEGKENAQPGSSKVHGKAVGTVKLIKAPKVKQEKVRKELPEYPVEEASMRELKECVVCSMKWKPKMMLKTKWVSLLACSISLMGPSSPNRSFSLLRCHRDICLNVRTRQTLRNLSPCQQSRHLSRKSFRNSLASSNILQCTHKLPC